MEGARRVATKAAALASYDDRFLRWQVTSAGFQCAWVGERAVVVSRRRGAHPQLIALGRGPQVADLIGLAAAELPAPQLRDGSLRLTIEAVVADQLPAGMALAAAESDAWEWMWTQDQPPPVGGESAVRWTHDMDAVKDLLGEANPRHHGRPGDPDIRGWAAVVDRDGRLVCTGALVDLDTGVPHLRSITTAQHARRQGLGAAVSAFLTRAALASQPPAVTLGLYSDNAAAKQLYSRLGYRFSHALVSGPLRRRAASRPGA